MMPIVFLTINEREEILWSHEPTNHANESEVKNMAFASE